MNAVLGKKVWLGDRDDILARRHAGVVDVILNVACDFEDHVKDVPHLNSNLIDGPGNKQQEFDDAVYKLAELVDSKRRVLIHCMGGVSRSAAVLSAFIAWRTKRPFEEAVFFVKLHRHVVDPCPALREHGERFIRHHK